VTAAALDRVGILADDIGRLRRLVPADGYVGFLLDRLGGHVEALDAMLGTTAAERYRAHVLFGLDEDEAVREALAAADGDARGMRLRLGVNEERAA
jgi:hypothetical protein